MEKTELQSTTLIDVRSHHRARGGDSRNALHVTSAYKRLGALTEEKKAILNFCSYFSLASAYIVFSLTNLTVGVFEPDHLRSGLNANVVVTCAGHLSIGSGHRLPKKEELTIGDSAGDLFSSPV